MKLFLSWSGNESKQLASIFKEWIPNVLQYTEPYMSAKDISLGEMWNNNIRNNLEESVFGLVFVTPDNINAPWINYEAGALSKTLDSKVVPILHRADVMILNEGPLKQFQSVKRLEKDDVYTLLKSINSSNDSIKLDGARLDKAFNIWWPYLEEQISKVTTDENSSVDSEPSEKELLSVIYSKIIENEKQLKDNRHKELFVSTSLIRDIRLAKRTLKHCHSLLEGGPFQDEIFMDINGSIVALENALDYLNSNRHLPQAKVRHIDIDVLRNG